VTVVIPTLKVKDVGNPESASVVAPEVLYPVVVTAQLSEAVGTAKDTSLEHKPGALFVVVFVGHPVSVGASTSFTAMVNVQEALLPDISKALKTTVVVPAGKRPETNVLKLDKGTDPAECDVEATPQLSLQVGFAIVKKRTQEEGDVV
jgi:hypothetical protein